MMIQSLELLNFRNYKKLSIDFDRSINILYGNNAQGKTNILEAIFLSGTTKSHKGSKDKEIIYFKEEQSHIRSVFLKNDIDYRIDMHLRKNKSKGIAINGLGIKKASELIGLVNVVFFSPEDLNIIKNGPHERRRFLDLELCQLDNTYLYYLSNYNKAANQRNRLLKDIDNKRSLQDTLDIWDEQLLSYGSEIIKKRLDFISCTNDIIYDIHKNLSGNTEELTIKYEPDTEVERFAENLKKARLKDMKFKTTSVGPHRDDILFLINGIDIRKYGSQGQQRTAALSLKLSEIESIKQIKNNHPILLLDDVLSELDASRQNYLLNSIGNIQTIITCTGLDEFIQSKLDIHRIYRVVDGEVMKES